jgi:hypothetical protein
VTQLHAIIDDPMNFNYQKEKIFMNESSLERTEHSGGIKIRLGQRHILIKLNLVSGNADVSGHVYCSCKILILDIP